MKQGAAKKTRVFPVLLALGGLFGAAFLFMKVLVDEIAPAEIVAGRLTLGALVVFAIMAIRGKSFRISPSMLGKVALLALMDSVLPFTVIAWSETRIESGTASVLVSTMPIFTVLFATVALPEERVSPARLLGIPLGLAGVVVLTGGNVLNVSSSSAAGQLAVVGAAACYGAAAVYARVLLRTEDALSLAGPKLAVGAVMAFALTAVIDGAPGYAGLSTEGWLALCALGVLSTALAFIAYLWVVSTAGSVYASLVTYIVPVAGLLLGWAVLGEAIGVETALGTGIIALGVAGVMYGPAILPRLARLTPRVAGFRRSRRAAPGDQRAEPRTA